MTGLYNLEPFHTGFSFDNCRRNAFIESKGYAPMKARKTGTTIVGILVKDGVILGADTRASEDTIVADKNCRKIHYLTKQMYCCGAGTAADTDMTTNMISSQLELLRLNTGRTVPVVAATTLLSQLLFKYQGYIGAALVLGGVDNSGGHLYTILPHGSRERHCYTALGSGSLAAMSILEANWRADLTVEEGKKIVRDAVAAGVFNDLSSGNNIDICVILKGGSVDYIRPYEEAVVKGIRQGSYKYPKGATTVLTKKVKQIPLIIEDQQVTKLIASTSVTEQPMDVSA